MQEITHFEVGKKRIHENIVEIGFIKHPEMPREVVLAALLAPALQAARDPR
jgi:hypothetical protein